MKYISIIGKKYGRLLILKKVSIPNKRYKVLCKCDCGNEKLIRPNDIRSGKTKSCGCYAREVLNMCRTKHNLCNTKEYRIWHSMKDRCLVKNNKQYKNYGGRGIFVCKEWLDFKNFYKDMGEKPDGLTLDRINNDDGYYKDNCRWTDIKTQANNTRRNIFVTINKQKSSLKELSKVFGINYRTLYDRLFVQNLSLRKAILF